MATSPKKSTKLPSQKFSIKYPYLILLFLIILIYGRTLSFEFSFHDDDTMIVQNAVLHEGYTNLKMAFTTDAWFRVKQIELYRPLQSLSYMLDYSIGKTEPWAYHLSNLIFHFLCCCLLFQLLKTIGFNSLLSFTGAAIQAVHFSFLHTVSWIPARGDLLLTLFALLSLWAFIKWEKEKKTWILLLHYTSFFLALLAKETAILLPLLFLLFKVLRSEHKVFSSSNVIIAMGYIIPLLPYLIIRHQAIAPSSATVGVTPFLENLPILAETFVKYFIPLNFSVMPTFQPGSTIIGFIALILALYFIIKWKKKEKGLVWFGFVFFILLIVPSMLYRPDFSEYGYAYLDHRIYLPAIGLTIILLEVADSYKFHEKRYFPHFLISGLVVTGILTFVLSAHYRTPLSYLTQAVASNQKSALASILRGNIYKDSGDHASAINDYSRAIELKPDYGDAYRNRGNLHKELNNFQLAFTDLTKANELLPDKTAILINLSATEVQLQQNEKAIVHLTSLLDKDPENAIAFVLKGNANKNLKNFEEALKDYSMAIRLDPNLTDAYMARGVLYGGLKNFQASVEDLSVFLKSKPSGDAYFFRGLAFSNLNLPDKACEDWQKAADLNVSKAKSLLQTACNN